jgi:hypothetical protein
MVECVEKLLRLPNLRWADQPWTSDPGPICAASPGTCRLVWLFLVIGIKSARAEAPPSLSKDGTSPKVHPCVGSPRAVINQLRVWVPVSGQRGQFPKWQVCFSVSAPVAIQSRVVTAPRLQELLPPSCDSSHTLAVAASPRFHTGLDLQPCKAKHGVVVHRNV